MIGNKATFDGAMNALRRKYAGHLRERERQIRELLSQHDEKEFTVTAREQLYNHAHSLAGSGATYGYPDITKAARELEDALGTESGQEKLVALTHDLLAVCCSVASGQGAPVELSGIKIISKVKSLAKNKKTLLIIDDDVSIHEFVTELFKNEFNIIVSSTGNDGLAIIRIQHPDLILLDGTLADFEGLKLLETLKAEPATAKIPVIMVTAHNRSTYIEQAIKTGALEYVVKPLDPKILRTKVRGLLARIGITILIADDDESIRGPLSRKFLDIGMSVWQAADGEEALSLAVQYRPQLALIDWMMPRMDGLTLIRKFKEAPELKDMQVIMLTSKQKKEDVLESLHSGVQDYIVKPFAVEDVVRRCLDRLGLA